jgi:hypothetical protein
MQLLMHEICMLHDIASLKLRVKQMPRNKATKLLERIPPDPNQGRPVSPESFLADLAE